MQSFRKLLVWQKAHALSRRIDQVTDRFEKQTPRLARQLQDGAAAIPAAIAEGRGRRTDPDFAHFLTIGVGFSNQLENNLQRAFDRRLITRDEHEELTDSTIEVRKMLVGLRKTLLRNPKPKQTQDPRETKLAADG
jgi:four helix bundle protein